VEELKIIWLSDYPLLGTSFGTVTYEMTMRMQHKFFCLSLGYEGLPITLNEHVSVYPLKKNYQLDYYAKKLADADRLIMFHSCYFLEKIGDKIKNFRMEKILYLPYEGEDVPLHYQELIKKFDKVITPSKYSARILRKAGIKAEVVPHGVDTSFFTPTQEMWREFRFGYIGLNDIRKQLPRVFYAYKRLGKGILAIAASAEGHYDLLELSRRLKISPVFIEQKLHGIPLSREGVRDFLRTLDVYISPGTESFGLPALEAQACGVPVIASEHGASREVLGNGALYVKVNEFLETNVGRIGLISVPDLYRKMRFLMEVEQAYKKTKRKAIENAKRWTWDKAVKELENVL